MRKDEWRLSDVRHKQYACAWAKITPVPSIRTSSTSQQYRRTQNPNILDNSNQIFTVWSKCPNRSHNWSAEAATPWNHSNQKKTNHVHAGHAEPTKWIDAQNRLLNCCHATWKLDWNFERVWNWSEQRCESDCWTRSVSSSFGEVAPPVKVIWSMILTIVKHFQRNDWCNYDRRVRKEWSFGMISDRWSKKSYHHAWNDDFASNIARCSDKSVITMRCAHALDMRFLQDLYWDKRFMYPLRHRPILGELAAPKVWIRISGTDSACTTAVTTSMHANHHIQIISPKKALKSSLNTEFLKL
jgi:hypothetical protein